jgi:hypothetical protein
MFPRRVFASIVKAAMSVFVAGCSSRVDPATSTGAPKGPGTPRPASSIGSQAPSPKISGQNESAQRYIDQGNQKLKSGDMAGGISDLTKAIEIDPATFPLTTIAATFGSKFGTFAAQSPTSVKSPSSIQVWIQRTC